MGGNLVLDPQAYFQEHIQGIIIFGAFYIIMYKV